MTLNLTMKLLFYCNPKNHYSSSFSMPSYLGRPCLKRIYDLLYRVKPKHKTVNTINSAYSQMTTSNRKEKKTSLSLLLSLVDFLEGKSLPNV